MARALHKSHALREATHAESAPRVVRRARVLHKLSALVLVLLCFIGAACDGDGAGRQVLPRWVVPEPTLDFGPVPALNERTVTLPLVNAGRASLHILGVTVREAETPFRVVSAPEQVAAQSEASLTLAFTPPREAAYVATLELRTDDPERSTAEVSLRGEGRTAAVIELDPQQLDFGRVAEGSAAVRTFTVRSRGSAPLVLEEVALTSDTPSTFELVGSTKTPAVLDAGREVPLTVRYTAPVGAESEQTSGTLRLRTTDPDHREATVSLRGGVNRAPLPVIVSLRATAPGQQVKLDATASQDPDGDEPLEYEWALRQRPVGAQATIADARAASTVLQLDPVVPGEYEVELHVTDAAGARSLHPATARVLAVPAQRLLVDVSWNNAVTDLDLHVLRNTGAELGSAPDDCHYANPRPDWGDPGPLDDPELLRDRLTGYGPEVFGYEVPVTGTYRVAVVLARENGAVDPRSEATVRIYDRGALKGEYRRTLAKQGDAWMVADVQWPAGIVTEVP
ncbi:choice-of-anchor D domain-containing protein [Pyxidicoccus parkwayensis]|uniref:Choice-of-anchor D domain-containing protein n=1 Tax=Pyxidicoccus parkwayensis TaxID=2813578 RepID=A0ABX7NV68_9BACT|nr:choice-of-anchor D domain-containing protein [Pyxidicoccus parkwaysis]QSQ22296.1 choice-of-anchor D domain-containing protein [Pyxidicoccus parkwaysis]